MSMKKDTYESIYKDIENNFNSKFFDFNYSKNDINKELNYYKALNLYLRDKGYGYAASQIDTLINKKNIDKIEVAKLLMDCNLINKYNQSMKSNIENKAVIEYLKKDGLRTSKNGKQDSIHIEYKTNIPFKIVNVAYSNIDVISHKCGQKNVVIDINIGENKKVNFTEIISIYTPYGVDKLEFTVKCKDNIYNDIGVENIEQYLLLCKSNPEGAKIIFDKDDFKDWLIEEDYKVQILNYQQAKLLKQNNIFSNEFIAFCRLNEIYIEINENEPIIKNKPTIENEIVENETKDDKDINNNPSDNKETDKEEDHKLETYKDETDKEDDDNNDSEDRHKKPEAEKKDVFSGIKKTLGSIFKRK